MNRLFRTLFIFLVLLTTRGAVAQPVQAKISVVNSNGYSVTQAARSEVDELNELEDFQRYLPLQNSRDLDELMQQTEAAQSELASLINLVSAQTQTQAIIAQPKSRIRAEQKIATKFAGETAKITDLARASIVASDVSSLMSAYKQLEQHAEIVQLKNRFANPKASGYRDLNALVKLPNSQMIVEVQLHLNDIAEIKSGAEHDTYVQVQAIEANAKRQQRQLNDIETAQITKLRQASHKLYHKAWLGYKRQNIAAHTLTAA
ncbi:GTP pyrophosphokinase [Shewanella maritima]|uniref:GTP pyrophosphokinase n=1 Tax=Shewanella maritima TaxID=2520507 RepID=A0A411PEN5_9GAMM|nr:GTP pyrophosphokinase [Shewanella maritima]QBF82046.1 GTP pyrophosphokinase [Shewanella maritima]